jgi:predicted anti-sigma-YlaC factor YlaD
MTCKEISKLVSESLDRKLPLRQRMGVRMHLMMCSMCRAYEKQTLLLRKAVRTYGRSDNEKLPEESKQRIKKTLSDQDHTI